MNYYPSNVVANGHPNTGRGAMTKLHWPLPLEEYEALQLQARIERSRVFNAALRTLFAASARWLRRTGAAALHPFVARGRRMTPGPRRLAQHCRP